jgi:hypothetical protein
LIGVTSLLFGGDALAAVKLCVTVHADAADQVGFEKLVRSEVGKHPSHQIVEKDCESNLIVESFMTAGSRFLTVQLDGEVPERATIAKSEELPGKLADSVSLVLGNDPMHLAEDPAQFGGMQRAAHSVLVRGLNTYRLELFETMMRTDKNIAFAPGFALGMARGADQWQVHARLHLSGWPQAVEEQGRALRVSAGMDVGALYETSRKAMTSAYFGAGAGLVLLRLEGLVDPKNPSTAQAVDDIGATLNLRAGVRFLRFFDFDADAFVQANFPLFATHETDDPLFGEKGVYTPYLQVGVGVGF